jgi:hypothetical protein
VQLKAFKKSDHAIVETRNLKKMKKHKVACPTVYILIKVNVKRTSNCTKYKIMQK